MLEIRELPRLKPDALFRWEIAFRLIFKDEYGDHVGELWCEHTVGPLLDFHGWDADTGPLEDAIRCTFPSAKFRPKGSRQTLLLSDSDFVLLRLWARAFDDD